MDHPRVQLGLLLPLDGASDSKGKIQSIALFEGFNTVGRGDLHIASKQISRKHVSIHASRDGSYQIAVEGQNPIVVRKGDQRHELKSNTKISLSVGDIVELLPGKHAFKLKAVAEGSLGEEHHEEESHDILKRKRQEIEDECLARELQAIEDEHAKSSCIGRSLEKGGTSKGDNCILPAVGSSQFARTFRLLRVQGLPSWANVGCISIQDVIEGDVLFTLLSNYMVDLDWLLSACPLLKHIPRVVVVHGESGGSLDHLKAGKPSGWLLHKPPLPLSYGTHHSKAMILIYQTGVRVVVHTANLIFVDWNNKTQGLWMQDFPYKSEAQKSISSPFEDDLVEYLEALQWPGCSVNLPNCMNAQINAAYFRQFDYTSAQVRLIASVPGYHQGHKLKKWGHMKLRSVLEHECFEEEFVNAPLVYQFSSLGSLDEKWLAEFNSSTSAGKAPDKALGLGNFQILWPTVEDVRCSIEGYAAGNAIPSPLQNVEKGFLRKYWARWEADHSGRSRAMPHFKSYARYKGQNLAWFLLTSSNLSKAAWGALQKNGTQQMIRSYELGVLFLPSMQKNGSSFTCTAGKFLIQENGDTKPSRARPKFYESQRGGKVKFVTTCCDETNAQVEHFNTVCLPVPYRLPPKAYSSEDVPWSWDRQYSKPDTYGELWPRAVKLYGMKQET